MAAPIVYAGLAVASYAFGNKAKKKATKEERERILKQSWADYGTSAFEFDRSRAQQKEYHVTDMATAKAKLGASGVAPKSAQWYAVMGKYQQENKKALAAIDTREREWRNTQSYQIAAQDYESSSMYSVSGISRSLGLSGDTRDQLGRGKKTFTYEDYGYDNPFIPGYKGHKEKKHRGQQTYDAYTNITLSMEGIQYGVGRSGPTIREGGEYKPQYVSRGYYEAARPTMDEYYWMYHGGDETKAAESRAAITERTNEYLTMYGSPIALGPYENWTGNKRTSLTGQPAGVPIKT